MKSFLQKVGANRLLRAQALTVSFKKPLNYWLKQPLPCAACPMYRNNLRNGGGGGSRIQQGRKIDFRSRARRVTNSALIKMVLRVSFFIARRPSRTATHELSTRVSRPRRGQGVARDD